MEVNAQLQFNPEDSESCVQIAIQFPERPEVFQVFIRVDDPSSASKIYSLMLTVVINDESYVGEANTHDWCTSKLHCCGMQFLECKSSEYECF